jgi:hypothetical protein
MPSRLEDASEGKRGIVFFYCCRADFKREAKEGKRTGQKRERKAV